MGIFDRTRVVDPYNTMGAAPARKRDSGKPAGAAQRDTDRRKSSWLRTRQAEHPGTSACKDCKGTGSSGWKDDQGRTIVCSSCRGFGY